MNTFKVEVIETLSKIIEVKAATEVEALEQVENLYKAQEIILDAEDLVETEFHLAEE